MKVAEEKIVVDGPAGKIEVIMERPDAPRGIALIAHPHPMGGGANTNKVAYTLAKTFVSLGYAAFRPNFRGVGGTEGEHDEGVGETEESAKAKGIDYKVAKLPMAYAGRFIAENEGGSGLCKVLVGAKYGEVIGVHMLGNPCSEMIYGACMAIEQEMTLAEMEEVVFPHPTVSEIFKETIFAF